MSNPAGAPVPAILVSNQQIVHYRILPDGTGDPTSQGKVPLDQNSDAIAYPEHGGGNSYTWNTKLHVWNP